AFGRSAGRNPRRAVSGNNRARLSSRICGRSRDRLSVTARTGDQGALRSPSACGGAGARDRALLVPAAGRNGITPIGAVRGPHARREARPPPRSRSRAVPAGGPAAAVLGAADRAADRTRVALAADVALDAVDVAAGRSAASAAGRRGSPSATWRRRRFLLRL